MPAVLAEMFWSAELLVALGSTFGVMLDIDLATAIVVSAVVVTLYTMAGGMWAVAYTDAYQLMLVGIGLAITLPIALDAVGGVTAAWTLFQASRPDGALPVAARCGPAGTWTHAINCRVVGRQHHADARRHSVELLFPARAVVPIGERTRARIRFCRAC